MSHHPPRARAVVSATALLLAATALQVVPLRAQQRDSIMVRTSPALIKYGKWLTLLGAVAMGIKAADEHNDAERAFTRLQTYCDENILRCSQLPSGSYADPVSEGYYQSSLRHDRRARRWLLGGEVTLLGTAGLFVWELTRPKHPSRNIPFEPTITVAPTATRFGLRAAF